MLAEKLDDLRDLALAADERRRLRGQVRRVRAERPGRRKLIRKPFADELEELLRSAQVAQLVCAEVAERESAGKRLHCERGRRRGDQDLVAACRSCDARRSVHVGACVPVLGWKRRARVDAHPNANRACGERPLRVSGRLERGRSRRERDEEAVAGSVDLEPVVGLDRLADRAVVSGAKLLVGGLADALEQFRRPLDVGEEERDRAGRKLAHADSIAPPVKAT
jgi:hypothetical protein